MNSRFQFSRLDARTRAQMLKEIDLAHANAELYFSARFNGNGTQGWPAWLRTAAELHDEHWLAFQLEASRAMKQFETAAIPSGGYTTKHVPHTAAETLADGQFNRFYMASLCSLAIEDGVEQVSVYRAKQRNDPRPDSVALEGTTRDPKVLLAELRSKAASLKCDLLGPNSGLSVTY